MTEHIAGSIPIGLENISHIRRPSPDLRPPLVILFTRDPQVCFPSFKPLHITVVSKMLFVARHASRSSWSLGTVTRRPAALNVRFTGMGPNGLALRTLISEFLLP